tara:strand:- start:97 stop:696 length:600 start_codon:yes stop_codon:yes gene_type:complete
MNEVEQFQFWEDIYLSNDAGWDLKGPTPVFTKLADSLIQGSLCIIGCGKGYDAITFAKKGFDVTAIDFAPSAIKSLKKMERIEKVNINILQKDIFEIIPKFIDTFDYVIEQTCFCAIHPNRRKDYRDLVQGILKQNGQLIGLWFPLDKKISEGGPPYGVSINEIKNLFNPNWEIMKEEFSNDSVSSRVGREKLIIFKKC